jgi:signal transduction histidine kinase
MPFWTPVENPGTRPPRSWAFDIGCALLAALASLGVFSFAQTAHPAHPPLAASLAVAAATALVLSLRRVWPGPVFAVTVIIAALLAQWPVRGALYPVALAISLYTVAATMSRAAALTAAALAVAAEAPAAGQGGWHDGWLALIYEVTAIATVLYTTTRRAYLAELRDRAQRLEREHDQTSALAVAVERARIAREMHDNVAHHLTVIVTLSDGAMAAVTRAPDNAAARPHTRRPPSSWSSSGSSRKH